MNSYEEIQSRTAFYPACEKDYLEPLELLKNWVDVVYFCDIRLTSSHVSKMQDAKNLAREKSLPIPFFLCADALQAINHLRPVDVFFQRRDSHGEGGSGLFLLGNHRLPSVLEMIKPGGLIVTDGTYAGDWLAKLVSKIETSIEIAGRNITLLENQSWASNRLTAFRID
jgi:hypothetical protein